MLFCLKIMNHLRVMVPLQCDSMKFMAVVFHWNAFVFFSWLESNNYMCTVSYIYIYMVIAVRAHCNPLDIYIYISLFAVWALWWLHNAIQTMCKRTSRVPSAGVAIEPLWWQPWGHIVILWIYIYIYINSFYWEPNSLSGVTRIRTHDLLYLIQKLSLSSTD